MGTRSYNGYLDETGNIMASYCHHDGYPTELGPVLLDHYSTPEKAEEMVDFGDRSSLLADPALLSNPEAGSLSSSANGEPPTKFTVPEFIAMTTDEDTGWCEYTYLFAEGWLVAAHGRDSYLKPGKKLPSDSLGEPLHQVMEALR